MVSQVRVSIRVAMTGTQQPNKHVPWWKSDVKPMRSAEPLDAVGLRASHHGSEPLEYAAHGADLFVEPTLSMIRL